MPPAATLGSATSHGGVVVSGVPTVMIGGMPAAVAGMSMTTCPMFTGPVPHVGGPIILGSMTVLVMGMPLAYVGSTCTCVGPPSTIVSGVMNVIVRP